MLSQQLAGQLLDTEQPSTWASPTEPCPSGVERMSPEKTPGVAQAEPAPVLFQVTLDWFQFLRTRLTLNTVAGTQYL